MSEVNLTPFEQAVCALILKLPGTWTTPQWDELTHTLGKAMDRLVNGGFVEARLPVTLNVSGEPKPIRAVWRVTGNYGPVLRQQIQQYLVARAFGSKETVITCGEYLEVRLTAEGELAKEDFKGTVVTETSYGSDGTVSEKRAPGINRDLFTLVAGGPDGEGGVRPRGTVHLESDPPQPTPLSSPVVESVSRRLQFSVALSFAGEKREYVRQVDAALRAYLPDEEVFYDERFAYLLARPDLLPYLQAIYHDRSELLVVFLCADYERKEWCNMEWRAILDVIKKRRTEDVMPFRFDSAEIPGFFSTDGYVSAGTRTPKQSAELIYKRLLHNRAKRENGQKDA
ncbi:MAG: TIR domain-containing protein [Planctomycetes bacterium]|nr:TIR domain-containing protein [Planctomycetota bacterium]